jgi:hypothetical protein
VRPDRQQQDHHRHGQQEHRAPPEALEEQPTGDGADRGAGREAHDPHRDRERPLPVVEEHVPDQRERGRRQGRGRDPEEGARGDEHLGAGREGGEDGRSAERGGADEQQPAPADPVAQGAHRDEQPGEKEAVDVGDPQELGAAGLEVGAQLRDREEQDRQVHRVEQAGQGDHGESDPLPAPGRWGVRRHHT